MFTSLLHAFSRRNQIHSFYFNCVLAVSPIVSPGQFGVGGVITCFEVSFTNGETVHHTHKKTVKFCVSTVQVEVKLVGIPQKNTISARGCQKKVGGGLRATNLPLSITFFLFVVES